MFQRFHSNTETKRHASGQSCPIANKEALYLPTASTHIMWSVLPNRKQRGSVLTLCITSCGQSCPIANKEALYLLSASTHIMWSVLAHIMKAALYLHTIYLLRWRRMLPASLRIGIRRDRRRLVQDGCTRRCSFLLCFLRTI